MHTISFRIAILAGLILLALSPSGAQTVTEAWVQSDANVPFGIMIAMDSQENVVVTGWDFPVDPRIVTKKYDPSGNLLWEEHFSIPGFEVVSTWVTIDPSDNVIVTGYPRTISIHRVEVGLLTIKYDSNGNLLWSDTLSHPSALAARGITDADGNIYVAGRAFSGGIYGLVTIKYAPDGTRLWVDKFDTYFLMTPNSMDLDSEGHLIINGAIGISGGSKTVLYTADGVRQWAIELSDKTANWVKLTGDGHFYLTGINNIPVDIWLAKYDLSANLIWEQRYDFGNTTEYGTTLTLDSQGNVIVTGNQDFYKHWITLKVDPEGTLLWSNEYSENPGNNAYPTFITLGPDDEVYITGTGGPPPPPCCSFQSMATLRYNSDGSNPWAISYPDVSRGLGLVLASDNSVYVVGNADLTVVKYSQTTAGGGIPCSDITSMAARCIGGGTKTIQVRVNLMNNIIHAGEPVTITIDGTPFTATIISNGTHSRANFCVLGWSVGDHIVSLVDPPGCLADVHPTCVAGDGIAKADPEWDDDAAWSGQSVPQATNLLGNYPNPFNPSTSIQYALGEESHVTLKVYNTLGQEVATLVNEVQSSGYKTTIWNGRNDTGSPVASGVYIYTLKAGNLAKSQRMLLMK